MLTTFLTTIACYLGVDRLVYAPALNVCRHIINLPNQSWLTLSACVSIGALRILFCIVAVSILLSIPTSHPLTPLLCVIDLILHDFISARRRFNYNDPVGRTAVKFCRWMTISQVVMLGIAFALMVYGIRIRQYL